MHIIISRVGSGSRSERNNYGSGSRYERISMYLDLDPDPDQIQPKPTNQKQNFTKCNKNACCAKYNRLSRNKTKCSGFVCCEFFKLENPTTHPFLYESLYQGHDLLLKTLGMGLAYGLNTGSTSL